MKMSRFYCSIRYSFLLNLINLSLDTIKITFEKRNMQTKKEEAHYLHSVISERWF